MNIDGELEDTKGVIAANTNYAKAETEITFDGEKLKEEHIVRIIKSTGYDATPISSEQKS